MKKILLTLFALIFATALVNAFGNYDQVVISVEAARDFSRITFPDGFVINNPPGPQNNFISSAIRINAMNNAFRESGRNGSAIHYLSSPISHNGVSYSILLDSVDNNGRFMSYALPGNSLTYYYKNYALNDERAYFAFNTTAANSVIIQVGEFIQRHGYGWEFYYNNATNQFILDSAYVDSPNTNQEKVLAKHLSPQQFTSPRGSKLGAVTANLIDFDYVLNESNVTDTAVFVDKYSDFSRTVKYYGYNLPAFQFNPTDAIRVTARVYGAFKFSGYVNSQFYYLLAPVVYKGQNFKYIMEDPLTGTKYLFTDGIESPRGSGKIKFYYSGFENVNSPFAEVKFTTPRQNGQLIGVHVFISEALTNNRVGQWEGYYDAASENFEDTNGDSDNLYAYLINQNIQRTIPVGFVSPRCSTLVSSAAAQYQIRYMRQLGAGCAVNQNAAPAGDMVVNRREPPVPDVPPRVVVMPPQGDNGALPPYLAKGSTAKPGFVEGIVGWVKNLFGD